eukprot:EC724274.1.p1 GENE.EC724274.1~~EC724274.1.p1  ORF type:complete len:110 (+),score=28.06 EC724274.1:314-643(+)
MFSLQYVRPGSGFKPNFPIFGKIKVNGENAHPLYKWLRSQLPEIQEPGNRAWVTDEAPTRLAVKPIDVQAAEVQWNFEKFLIDRSGKPVKRFMPQFKPEDVAPEIEKLL